jgi:hypothetical protein
MRIIESYLMGKSGNPAQCEDAIVVNDHFVAILDGATSPLVEFDGDLTPGKKAVIRAADVLNHTDGDSDAHELFRRLDAAIADIYHEEDIYEQARLNPEYRCSMVAIIYSRAHSELSMIGDCQALVDKTLFTAQKKADTLLAEVRAMFLESEILSGKTIDELRTRDTGREFIRELLLRQKQFQNRVCDYPYAYSVLDGFLIRPDEAIQRHSVPASCTQLVLASDGYPVLKGSLEETEQALGEIIQQDPLCFREYKSTKGVYEGCLSFDDRSYIRIEPD